LQLQLASPLKTSKKKSQKKYSEISSSSREQQTEKLRNLRQGTKTVGENMADSPVSYLLDRLTWLLQEEVNLQRGVREDVRYIKDELERHKAILMVADSLEDKDLELKVWVKRVRDIKTCFPIHKLEL
jgi:hypothetical protein